MFVKRFECMNKITSPLATAKVPSSLRYLDMSAVLDAHTAIEYY